MARITCEDCLDRVGDHNRFNLIHLTVKRVKQHRQGEPFLVEGKNKEIVMSLREIAAGKVTFANIDELPDMPNLVVKPLAGVTLEPEKTPTLL